MSEYEMQAKNFCCKHHIGIKMKYEGIEIKWHAERPVYNVIITSKYHDKTETMSIKFYDSVMAMKRGTKPSEYDILASLTKIDPGSDVWDFVEGFGYDIKNAEDGREADRIYKAVCQEYQDVCRVFEHCLEELQEIW